MKRALKPIFGGNFDGFQQYITVMSWKRVIEVFLFLFWEGVRATDPPPCTLKIVVKV